MSRNRKIFIIALSVAFVLGLSVPFFNAKTVEEIANPIASTSTVVEVPVVKSVGQDLIEVSFSVGDRSFKEKLKEGSTAYDLMEKLRNSGLISFTADYYEGIGNFITSIDGVENDGRQGKYWTYYVNGEEAVVGASTYVLKRDDSVTWRYGTELKKDI